MRLLTILLTLIVISCSTGKVAMSVNSKAYDAAFLKASYLIGQDKVDEALAILYAINKEIKDEYLVLKISDIHLKQQRPDEALRVLEEATVHETLKQSHGIYYQKAKLLFSFAKKDKEAFDAIKAAIRIEDKSEYLRLLATFHIAQKDYASAIRQYDTLVKREPVSDNYFSRGQLYLKLNLEKKAIKDFESAVSIDQHTKSLLTLAELHIRKRDFINAIKYLEAVKDIQPVEMLVKYRLGELYLEEKRIDDAISIYEDIEPRMKGKEQLHVQKQLAKLYFDKRNFEKAQRLFIQILEQNPNDIQAAYFAGITSEALKQNQAAATYYQKALDIRSDYAQVLKRLAFIRFQDKSLDEALAYLNKVDSRDTDVEYYRLKSLIYMELKNELAQEETLNAGMKQFRDNEELMMDYAILLEAQGRNDESIDVLKKLLEINPANPATLNFLGYMYADLNIQLEDGLSLVKEALKLSPNNPAYLDSMAWVLYRMGKYEEAYGFQKRALKMLPEEAEINEHMNAILKALGSSKTAADVLKELQ